MDLKQIEYFVRVAELGSFTRASVVLDIAQRKAAAQDGTWRSTRWYSSQPAASDSTNASTIPTVLISADIGQARLTTALTSKQTAKWIRNTE